MVGRGRRQGCACQGHDASAARGPRHRLEPLGDDRAARRRRDVREEAGGTGRGPHPSGRRCGGALGTRLQVEEDHWAAADGPRLLRRSRQHLPRRDPLRRFGAPEHAREGAEPRRVRPGVGGVRQVDAARLRGGIDPHRGQGGGAGARQAGPAPLDLQQRKVRPVQRARRVVGRGRAHVLRVRRVPAARPESRRGGRGGCAPQAV
mmetsp:Transcript_15828/g.47036  ORF Transcript_15828/g.47036 Transcript_15828/m.47036 type:complete len:205 (-) Transcript_15828:388-1002(-)